MSEPFGIQLTKFPCEPKDHLFIAFNIKEGKVLELICQKCLGIVEPNPKHKFILNENSKWLPAEHHRSSTKHDQD